MVPIVQSIWDHVCGRYLCCHIWIKDRCSWRQICNNSSYWLVLKRFFPLLVSASVIPADVLLLCLFTHVYFLSGFKFFSLCLDGKDQWMNLLHFIECVLALSMHIHLETLSLSTFLFVFSICLTLWVHFSMFVLTLSSITGNCFPLGH